MNVSFTSDVGGYLESESEEITRAGPQVHESEHGGWWLQDDDEDFEGGEFEDAEIGDNVVQAVREALPLSDWEWEGVNLNLNPGPRRGHAMAYDIENKKVVLFGGKYSDSQGQHYYPNTWVFDVATNQWNQIGSGPGEREGHSMVYDEYNRRVLLFGGVKWQSPNPIYYGDTWFYDTENNTWDLVSDSGLPARRYHSMAYDRINQKIVVYGGDGEVPNCGFKTCIFMCRDKTWFQVPEDGPVYTTTGDIAFDNNLNKIVLYGAHDGTWLFNTNNNMWQEFQNIGSFGTMEHYSCIYDEKSQKTVIYGGSKNNQPDLSSETWTLNSSGWIKGISGPVGRNQHDMVYDSHNHKSILFGGYAQDYLSDTWTLTTSQIVPEATYTSPSISLPLNQQWDELNINATEPDNTKLTVSVMNADTGLYIPDYRDMEPREVDLSGLDAANIKLRCHLESSGDISPELDSWKVTWKPKVVEPVYLGGIPSALYVTEDTPQDNILNLSEYFGEGRRSNTRSTGLDYSFASISNTDNITLLIDEDHIDVIYLEDNWTGKTDVVVECENTEGTTVQSPRFSIIVQGVNDPPAWRLPLPPIIMDEGFQFKSAFKVDDYILDAEEDMMDITASCDNPDVSVVVDPETRIIITPKEDFYGLANVTVAVKETYDPSNKIQQSVSLIVNSVNDDPVIELLTPGDNAVFNDVNVTLSWMGSDIETPIDQLTYDVFLGNDLDPAIHSRGIKNTSILLSSLSDKSTYRWKVAVWDTQGKMVSSPVRTFRIDTDSDPLPGSSGEGLKFTVEVTGEEVSVAQGNTTSFNVKVTNDDSMDLTLGVLAAGMTAPYVDVDNILTLEKEKSKDLTVLISPGYSVKPGDYDLVLLFISPDGVKCVTIPIDILKGTDPSDTTGNDDEEDDDSEPKDQNTEEPATKTSSSVNDTLFYMIIAVLVLVLILLAIGFLITYRKTEQLQTEIDQKREQSPETQKESPPEVVETEMYYPENNKAFTPQPRMDQSGADYNMPGSFPPGDYPPVNQHIDVQLPGLPPERESLPEMTQASSKEVVQTQPPTPAGPEVQLPQSVQTPIPSEDMKMLPQKVTPPPPP